jgi:CBS domain containing-hemolysin-like protein
VAGLLLGELRRLPVEGDAVIVGDHRFTVAKLRNRAIDQVRIEPVQPPAGAGTSR